MKNNKALLLIDYTNDIVHPEGKIAGCAAMIKDNNIVAKCNKLLAHARLQGWLVIWVKVGFESGYPEVHVNSPIFSNAKLYQALAKGSWGTELLEGLDYRQGELVIFKNRINPFYATSLDLVLNANHIDEIYLAGVSTEWAIEAATRDGHDRNYTVTILQDLCASSDIKMHEHTLKVMARIARIISSEEAAEE